MVSSAGRRIAKVDAAVEADADASYGQAEADLINELKAQLNALIAALQDAQLMEQ